MGDSEGAADPQETPTLLNLDGLGLELARDEEIWSRALEIKALLKWQDPKKAGTINMQTMAMNAKIVLHVLRKWVPQLTTKLKTVNVNLVQHEAG